MHTKDKLAEALTEAGLVEMAEKARAGYYHDFMSPLALPALQLADDLARKATPEALAIRVRHINGEFDAAPDEFGPDGGADAR